jgi:hypothetical protein
VFCGGVAHLNEVQQRVVAGASAEMLGRGGKSWVAVASGMSRNTVIKAEGEVAAGIVPQVRLRASGAGAKPLTELQPGLLEALDQLVHPDTRESDVVAEMDIEIDRETCERTGPSRVHDL